MLAGRGAVDSWGVLAHPLTEPHGLPLSPLLLGYLAAAVVVLAGLAWPGRTATREADAPWAAAEATSWAARLTPAMRATRAVAVLLIVVAIVAGRFGADDELENLAPALAIGTVWPLLVLASSTVGPVWRWVDPWDSLARALASPPKKGQADLAARSSSLWPAVILTATWVWYLSAYPDALEPRSVGLLLALYTIGTVAACLAVGRQQWLSRGEPLGILLGWFALLPRRRLRAWQPPPGTDLLLGLLAGGALFGAIRRSDLWGSLNTVSAAGLLAAAGLALTGTTVAGLLVMTRRLARHADPADVTKAALPAVAGIVVAVALDQNRLTTSLQLLPGLLGDPLGLGWDLFGPAGAWLDPTPFGTTGLAVVQLSLVVLAAVAGVVAVGRTAPRRARLPAVTSSALLTYLAALVLAAH